ncbi:hypothetical protein NW762_002845 [Fusarium torreyae]|uniref:Uncharacterized protein n=1 Tax=Fusarium torreyae TaxID=1237075 RepID=A0A9W8VKI1_9HYPO|nr:hypothetical protein NW762_002845 [Fusarium torreyae]
MVRTGKSRAPRKPRRVRPMFRPTIRSPHHTLVDRQDHLEESISVNNDSPGNADKVETAESDDIKAASSKTRELLVRQNIDLHSHLLSYPPSASPYHPRPASTPLSSSTTTLWSPTTTPPIPPYPHPPRPPPSPSPLPSPPHTPPPIPPYPPAPAPPPMSTKRDVSSKDESSEFAAEADSEDD